LLGLVRKVAAGESNVLLLGESGVGKEVVAQAIRSSGPRAGKPYVAINAAALPDNVLESELFGHERGAFTGATERRLGLFELASGGTLFLDEAGDLAPATQAKLLRALETGEIRRLGGNETIHVDVRLIAATNRDLRRDVRERLFREDLFYRLAVVELRVPPLRDRPEDLEPLVRHILRSLAGDAKRPVEVAPEALAALRAYSFPGNVRELRNLIESALNFCEGGIIRLEDLPPLPGHVPLAHDDFPSLATVERAHIESALRRARWNKSRAAALLAIDRKTLYAKIETYGLRPEAPQTSAEPDAELEPSSAASTE
ncbi:MAG TPA: sigma-54 dependent transcriptional regulator, partial [Planctomycetota bacterium]|nr:sigma-54 dependent transcriptional regulator [Planctomycetota bacterium]